MVNVGGRSKGCSTCRRRKVKCDETRPVCKRCQKSDLVCDGAKDITFIEAKIVKSRRSEKQPTISREHETKELDSGGRQILSPISQRGNETEIYLCYALRHLVRGGAIDLALRTSRSNELVEAGKTSASSEIFHQAVLSFAIIFFGTRHRQSSITNDGYVQLGGTLKQLNQALSEPDCYTRDEIILSVIALALLESLAPTGPDHYLQHMLGLERLIELRGPSAYCSPKTSQFFRGVRYMILFAALRTRRPSMLARPEWKKILRANCSQQTEQEEDLFDVIADCTVLLSDCNRVATVVGGDRENQLERDRIARRTLILLTFLDDWRERWSSDVVNSYAHILPEHQARNSETEESLFPLTVFEFSNDFSATMLIFYNTALIYVLQILTSLTSKNPDIEPSRRSTNTICRDTADTLYDLRKQINNEHITAKRSAALEICSCLPYLIRKSYLGSRVVHLAVTTAWSALGGNRTAEGRWIRNILSAGDREFIAKGIAMSQDLPMHADCIFRSQDITNDKCQTYHSRRTPLLLWHDSLMRPSRDMPTELVNRTAWLCMHHTQDMSLKTGNGEMHVYVGKTFLLSFLRPIVSTITKSHTIFRMPKDSSGSRADDSRRHSHRRRRSSRKHDDSQSSHVIQASEDLYGAPETDVDPSRIESLDKSLLSSTVSQVEEDKDRAAHEQAEKRARARENRHGRGSGAGSDISTESGAATERPGKKTDPSTPVRKDKRKYPPVSYRSKDSGQRPRSPMPNPPSTLRSQDSTSHPTGRSLMNRSEYRKTRDAEKAERSRTASRTEKESVYTEETTGSRKWRLSRAPKLGTSNPSEAPPSTTSKRGSLFGRLLSSKTVDPLADGDYRRRFEDLCSVCPPRIRDKLQSWEDYCSEYDKTRYELEPEKWFRDQKYTVTDQFLRLEEYWRDSEACRGNEEC